MQEPASQFAHINDLLALQRRSFQREGSPDLATRLDRLARLARMVLDNHETIVAAETEDFGGRGETLTRAADILGGVGVIDFHRENVGRWMTPEPVDLPPDAKAAGTRAHIDYQARGVVGVITPWNGPILLPVIAAANIMSAGNRLMLKPSELAPRSSALLARLFDDYFDPAEAAVIEGDADVSRAFTHQPFDHILFTGSARVGREVMKAAAENLVPVTLELGGKSPVIIGASVDMPVMAARLAHAKLAFAGQVCVTPDYVLAPKGQARHIADAVLDAAHEQFPEVSGNRDYTAIINDRHYARLIGLLDDARAKGGELLTALPDSGNDRKMPLCVVLNPTADMALMQEEIFGPILPILEYDRFEGALAFVNERDRPLSAYYFGTDPEEQRLVQDRIWTGSMVINDALCQIFYETLPFGGVGPSGMGRYRGFEGFKTFSNQRPVIVQSTGDEALAAMRPPYSEPVKRHIADTIGILAASKDEEASKGGS